MELSLLSVVDLDANTAYALEAKQTLDQKGKARVDLYAEQVPGGYQIIDYPTAMTENWSETSILFGK